MTFGEKIKNVRLQLFLSQEKFAKQLGVSFATVNRWEKGVCEPNYEGQKAFHDFAKKMIFIYNMTQYCHIYCCII